jgi:uncharacterized protein involved in exopolysaccharide biosynthesis
LEETIIRNQTMIKSWEEKYETSQQSFMTKYKTLEGTIEQLSAKVDELERHKSKRETESTITKRSSAMACWNRVESISWIITVHAHAR